jgi:PadR family transcriptional regulator, regulatory protein AphA
MSLPHVLLGLLSEEPRTGYDLARAIREDLDAIWRAELSQIYPALARLRRAGFVHLKVLGPRRGPRRNLYRVTAAGRRELKRWLAAAPAPPGKDEGLARVAFFDALPPSERRAAFLAQERSLAQEARRLRSSPFPSGFRSTARRGSIERLEAARRWLNAAAQEPAPAASPSAPGKKK